SLIGERGQKCPRSISLTVDVDDGENGRAYTICPGAPKERSVARRQLTTDHWQLLSLLLGAQLFDNLFNPVGVAGLWHEPQISLIILYSALVIASLNQAISQVEVRGGIIGRGRNRALIFFYFTVSITFFAKIQCKIKMSLGIVLLNINRFLTLRN